MCEFFSLMLFTLEETKPLNARAKQRSLVNRSEQCVKTDDCVVSDAGVRLPGGGDTVLPLDQRFGLLKSI